MSKGTFESEYTIVEVIKLKKNSKIKVYNIEKTCIVQNSIGQYYIAKKFYMSDIYALN